MFVPKEIIQAIIIGLIIGLSIIIASLLYNPKTVYEACLDEYLEEYLEGGEDRNRSDLLGKRIARDKCKGLFQIEKRLNN